MFTLQSISLMNVRLRVPPTTADDWEVSHFTQTGLVLTYRGNWGVWTVDVIGDFPQTDEPQTAADVEGTMSSRVVRLEGEFRSRATWSEEVAFYFSADSDLPFNQYLSMLSGDDLFSGVKGSGGNDMAQGMGGNDRFTGYDNTSAYGDFFFGGDGLDTSVYQGKISEYVITATQGTAENPHIYDQRTVAYELREGDGIRVPGFRIRDTVANRDDSDSLAEIERLEFKVAEANGANRVALDLEGSAGTVAKIVGALWGKEALDNPQLIGILLHGLDSGFTYDEVLDFALGALLGPNKTNDAVAELVYLNLIGEAPTEAKVDELASFMDSGAYTQAAFTRVVADLEINATNIDLVGLSNTGLQYVEYVG